MHEWKTLQEAWKDEAETRLNTDFGKLCTYGVRPLDDALLAIAPRELVVIGADSGSGKTETALTIAFTNLLRGRKVALYHLEGGYEEAISRIKWRKMCDRYFTSGMGGLHLDYRHWKLQCTGSDTQRFLQLESECYVEIQSQGMGDLWFYGSDKLSIDDFVSSLLDFHTIPTPREKKAYDLDLVVIDHLQYFSLEKAENEITEITKILRAVRRVNELGVPVVLVSHLRKKSRDRGLPDQEDFYGSSNIPKIATVAVTVSRDYSKDRPDEGIYPTYFRVCKSRLGVPPNYAMLVDFNLRTRQYGDTYQMYRINPQGHVAEEPVAENELPRWAKEGGCK